MVSKENRLSARNNEGHCACIAWMWDRIENFPRCSGSGSHSVAAGREPCRRVVVTARYARDLSRSPSESDFLARFSGHEPPVCCNTSSITILPPPARSPSATLYPTPGLRKNGRAACNRAHACRIPWTPAHRGSLFIWPDYAWTWWNLRRICGSLSHTTSIEWIDIVINGNWYSEPILNFFKFLCRVSGPENGQFLKVLKI